MVSVLAVGGLLPEVVDALARAAPGWPRSAEVSSVRMRPCAGGFSVVGQGVDAVAADPWEAANWMLAAAIGTEAETADDGIVLHAGATATATGAVLFAGASHAGKSAVGLHLAAAGVPLLGDDRILLRADGDPPQAVGLGLGRKVRPPYPDDFAPAARRLGLRTRIGHAAGADLLAWDPAIDRPAGTVAPVRAIRLLSRQPGADLAVTPLSPADAVAALLPLCGRHAGNSADLVARIAGLVARVPVTRLVAPNAAVAAETLIAASAEAGDAA